MPEIVVVEDEALASHFFVDHILHGDCVYFVQTFMSDTYETCARKMMDGYLRL